MYRNIALLALPTLINAVALSNMAPKAEGLPEACNAVYTEQIDGCTATDFETQTCSPACYEALVALQQPIQQACAGQVQGENLVVAFLAGVGPSAICHNAASLSTVSMTTAATSPWPTMHPHPSDPYPSQPHPSQWTPTIVSSVTTASSASDVSSLIIDTSKWHTHTTVPSTTSSDQVTQHKSHPTIVTSKTSVTSSAASTSKDILVDTSSSLTFSSLASKTSSAAGNSQTNMNDGSGGGSPFDSPGNTANAANSIAALSGASVLIAAAAAVFAFR